MEAVLATRRFPGPRRGLAGRRRNGSLPDIPMMDLGHRAGADQDDEAALLLGADADAGGAAARDPNIPAGNPEDFEGSLFRAAAALRARELGERDDMDPPPMNAVPL